MANQTPNDIETTAKSIPLFCKKKKKKKGGGGEEKKVGPDQLE